VTIKPGDNTASRLQAAAPPGVVLVGEATHRAAGEAIVFEPAGEQLLRGKVHGCCQQHLGNPDALLRGADSVSFQEAVEFVHGRGPGAVEWTDYKGGTRPSRKSA
jgi:hypothetical protein